MKSKLLVILLFSIFALIVGMAAALFGGIPALLLTLPLIAVLAVFFDYRVGVVLLAFLLPWASSPVLPQAQGFNVINYLTFATLVSFGVPALFRKKELVGIPRPLIAYYLVPLTVGVILAWPHLAEAVRNYSGTDSASAYEGLQFIKSRYLKPMAFIIFACLLANALRDSRKPERFLTSFLISSLLPALGVFFLIALYRVSLGDLQAQRNFLAPIGMHANEMAIMLAFSVGPILFMLGEFKSIVGRFLSTITLLMIVGALLLTFSRGGFIALVVIYAIYMIQSRRVTTLFVSVAVLLASLLFAPDAIKQRLLTGVESGAVSNAVGNSNDQLTAGRVVGWQKLAPEVLKSPLWGRGLGSTAWSDFVKSGQYRATHPHNMYLAMLMDLGFLGFAALMFWYYKIIHAQRALSRRETLSPLMRRFMSGSAASLIGVLVLCVTNGDFAPKPEQTFFWFSVGVLFAYWSQVEPTIFGARSKLAGERVIRGGMHRPA
nr:O-antigen ligase family protein [uncultured Roseateles sp.]